ncbi:MAG: VOC family protein [Burkholderiaceae bacterium]|nr:VOC family protein [Burkholderiaceae bacterium]
MNQSLGLVSLLVRDYDEAIHFYVRQLGFELAEDTPQPEQQRRWVVVRPRGAAGPQATGLLLARASNEAQTQRIGNQTGGRVGLFLYTDDIARDHAAYATAGVRFTRPPTAMPYGTVAVFADLYGNLWDLIQPGSA